MARAVEDLEDFLEPEEVDEAEDSKDFEAPVVPIPLGTKKCSAAMASYFEHLKRRCDEAYAVAGQARALGWEPEVLVEVPQAEDLAARVENLLLPILPHVKGVAAKIRALSEKHNREVVSLLVAKELAAELAPRQGREAALDAAIRTGLAILTEGVLVAPLEGVVGVKIKRNDDGTEFVAVQYAGPIRAAGGTAQALSVLIADVVRRELRLGKYGATTPEVERLKEEIPAYKQAQHLQRLPTSQEIELIARGCPVMIDGEGTEDTEVSGNRDLPRIETNRLRGGACLVLAEGLILKASKVQGHVKRLGIEGWGFLDAFANLKNDGEGAKAQTPLEAATAPSWKFIEDLVAGRPVLAHPGRKGGFRLRYGRARTGGLASTAIHPATMVLVEDFLAMGTQMKVERPGKATVVTPCDTIDGPIVLLDTGEVVALTSAKHALQIRPRVRRILDLGEILVPFGEFAENNKLLVPSGYCREWWVQECQRKLPVFAEPANASEAVDFSAETGMPLHPAWTLFWHDLPTADVLRLRELARKHGRVEGAAVVLPVEAAEILQELCCAHTRRPPGEVVLGDAAPVVLRCLGLEVRDGALAARTEPTALDDSLALVSQLAGFPVRARGLWRVGARMGRPEKAAERKMSPPVHTLFPIGQAGGLQRLVKDAAAKGTITVEVGARDCPRCGSKSLDNRCPCGAHTAARTDKPEQQKVDLGERLRRAQERVGLPKAPDIKGVQGLISKTKTPEPLEKGLLRAKHDVSVFKDGTVRFDMTDVPLTHFKPREAHASLAKLRELGYTHDCKGQPLVRDDQVCELRLQDVIVPRNGLEYLHKTANFVDELLEKFYGLPPFYKAPKPEDLVGQLVVGLAPHTSGGVLGRLIGWTTTQAGLAHPYWHAAKRRNCLTGDTDTFVLRDGAVERLTMEAFFRSVGAPVHRIDDAGTEAKDVQAISVLAADPTTGKVAWTLVRRVLRVASPDHWLTVRTASGRSVTCTPDHRFEVLRGSELRKRTAVELEEGDRLVFAASVPWPLRPAAPLDLLAELAKRPPPGLAVRGAGAWMRDAITELGGLKAAARSAGLSMKALDNYRRRSSIPWPVVRRLLEARGGSLSTLPRDVTLGVARDTAVLPRMITIGPELMRLVGYYLAEGHARAREGSLYQVSIACTETEVAEDVRRCARVALGLASRHDGRTVTMSGRVLHALFTQVLGLGANARTKRIPPRLATLPTDLTKELLAAYFAGDGSVEAGRLHVMCHSVSRGLLRDVGLQLASRGIAFRMRTEEREAGGAVREFLERKGRPVRRFLGHSISIRSSHAARFATEIGFTLSRKQKTLEADLGLERGSRFEAGPGDLVADAVVALTPRVGDGSPAYDLEVDGVHNFLVNELTLSSNCDGDEDCVMLLLDGLLNFSRAYLPEKRGGLMDAPLVLTTRLDPSEIDKEAHNLDVGWVYPLEFYEATQRCPAPKEVEALMDTVGKRIAEGQGRQYEGLGFTHDTTSIEDGPVQSSYKTLGTMMDKMDGQLRLAERIRAVDAADVAARVIEGHFLRDLQGNLKKFSKQKVRCVKCNAKYRRPPLKGACLRCGSNLTMTVHHASVIKYLEVSKRICEKYNVKPYTRQRLEILEESVNSLFQSDRVKKTSLKDFFGS